MRFLHLNVGQVFATFILTIIGKCCNLGVECISNLCLISSLVREGRSFPSLGPKMSWIICELEWMCVFLIAISTEASLYVNGILSSQIKHKVQIYCIIWIVFQDCTLINSLISKSNFLLLEHDNINAILFSYFPFYQWDSVKYCCFSTSLKKMFHFLDAAFHIKKK